MKVLVVGSGGREHAVAWKLAQSPRVKALYAAPGNGGMAGIARCVDISALDVAAMVAFAQKEKIELCAVTSDDPQAAGMVDAMRGAGIAAFGCTKAAARIESSKIFAKELMRKYNIPTARHMSFTDVKSALEYIDAQTPPIVVKADGLAVGKGVIIANTAQEAKAAVRDMMEGGLFSGAGKSVVIEEYMTGREVTVMAFTDGKTLKLMPPCRDHKRIGDGDTGPNTGGMGVISPVPDYTPEINERAAREIFLPTLNAMRAEGCPFTGVLYFELMLTKDGPKVIEYNARFGDPEAQVALTLLESDLLEIMLSVTQGTLEDAEIRFRESAAALVVLASRGYPGTPEKGKLITGLESVSPGTNIFHAGTRRENGGYYTNGGRVLGLCAVGDTLGGALDAVYGDISRVGFEGMQYRRDIGERER
ncbi:MAG: phosphoribosylamine--glycine ligase [Oscillospiraceae bacterium]|nr:phosphoribosylamine--glycine ligase [Oscillospiraceae bacterium]